MDQDSNTGTDENKNEQRFWTLVPVLGVKMVGDMLHDVIFFITPDLGNLGLLLTNLTKMIRTV